MTKQRLELKCSGEQRRLHNMSKSEGFGDSVEKFTEATGIKTFVDKVSQGLNIPCGCQQRKETLNKVFPYKQ